MSKTLEIGKKLKHYIPGGAHTYSKGDDQFPDNAPKCIERGKGCYVWDADGNKFIDWSMGLTSVAFGHANDEINQAAIDAMSLGLNFQRPSVMEAMAAEKFINFLKDRGEMVKFAKHGSSVTTAAVKLARAHTGRDLVGICAEHPFFSFDDWFIGATRCQGGIPEKYKELTRKFNYNNIDSIKELFASNPNQVACLIIEPVKFDVPKPGFLQEVYALCKQNGALLILDEMVTGFKWHHQGAGKYYGAKADLYTWGKGLANGHSVCALTGPREIMELGGIDHDKPRVFLISTTHGAEIPQLGAFIKILEILEKDPEFFAKNWKKAANIRHKLNGLLKEHSCENHLEFIGEDCFFALNIKNGGLHKANVAKTYLLQELVKEGQLFQGLFYTTVAHTEEAIHETLKAWNSALPRFKKFVESGKREELVGEPMKPVFRAFNSCECNSPTDCEKCMEKLNNRGKK